MTRYARPWTREERPTRWYLVSRGVAMFVVGWGLCVVVFLGATAVAR